MKKRLMLLLTCLFVGIALVTAQNQKVTGTVYSDEDGQPVVGASVLVKGTTIGTTTDIDGKFLLSVPSSGKTLKVSYIGMISQEVTVKPNLKISLKSNAQVTDEVIVVAYGTAKKSAFTGSASVIKSDKIAARQTSNVTNALSGQVAGVQVTSSNGQPGESAKIRVRGIGSMSASNSPLYVVDGAPYDGDISAINSQDIESMTVLKDAASNALYGARGANGVVLITTKKGQTGKATVNLDAKWGTNTRGVPNYNVMSDPATYYQTAYSALYNSKYKGTNADEAHKYANDQIFGNENGGVGYQVYTTPNGQDFIGKDGKVNPNSKLGYSDGKYYYTPDNWYNELFDKGNVRQEYNLNVSGATDKMNYFLSVGYLNDSGIIPNSGFERFSSRLRAEYQVKSWLKIGANMSYTNYDSKYPGEQSGSSSGNMFYVANLMAPIYPLYVRNPDGGIKVDSHGYTVYDFGDAASSNFTRSFMNKSNPASVLQLDKRNYQADVFGGKWFATIDLCKGLRATANIGVDINNRRYNQLYNAYYGQYAPTGGIVYVGNRRSFSTTQQFLLTYNTTIGENHNIDVLVGHEAYDYKYQYLNGSKENLYNPNVVEISNGIKNPGVESYTNNYGTEGWLARLQYDYSGKYFASASFRRDASSRFVKENRWGNFWSVGGGWLLNKEAFLADAKWVDALKFKISYGMQGNDNLLYKDVDDTNYYPYQDQYIVTNNNGSFATNLTYKGNKDITWETSHSFNTGFDFTFFSRLNGSVEFFSRKTTDMLYYKPVPLSAGYSFFPMNVGSMKNVGVELELNGDVVRTKGFEMNVNFNLTHFKNSIVKLDESLKGQLINGNRIYKEGESMYQMYLRKYAGVDKKTGESLWYKDVLDANKNVTGQETTSDWANATRYASGDILPKVYGGFGTTMKFYGFDASLSFAYQLGGRIYDNTYSSLMHGGSASDAGKNWHTDILNAWTPENTDTNVPRINSSDSYTTATSDRFMISSNYLSLQNVSIGYTLPKFITNKLQVGSIRAYFVADNVALFTKRKGLDPRQGYTASGSDSYSPIRSISGGVSIVF